jgi:DNA-3-methyladenine glycosylase
MIPRLNRNFFNRPTLEVAKELIGKILYFNGHSVIITETEAYHIQDDPACHAARGKTPRTEVMFGQAGFSYVYFIYGMHYCLNIVTEPENIAAAVLIRGAELIGDEKADLIGPGKLCKFLGVNKNHNKIDLCLSDDFYVSDQVLILLYIATPRIGISKGQDKLWRFVANI